MMNLRFKGLFVLLVSYLTTFSGFSQIEDPVEWSWKAYSSGEMEYDLVFTSKIDEHWHVYSQFLKEGGPLPTEFIFNESVGWNRIDSVSECQPITEFDPNFDMKLNYFEGTVNWWQKVKLNSDSVTSIKGYFSYMVCDESKCLPPEYIDFEFDLSSATDLPDDFEFCPSEPIDTGSHESEIEDPVDWTWNIYKTSDSEYDLVFTSAIDDHWHVYSQYLIGEGPLPTLFEFTETVGWSRIDSVNECSAITEFDPNFDMELNYFEGTVNWWQKIKLNSDTVKSINGYFSFMVCDESKCLPPEYVDFTFDLSSAKEKPSDLTYCDEKEEKEETPWGLFILGLGLGFAAVFTPCVFPLIPMTVSFFTKQSKSKAQGIRNALFYGFCIIFIYTGLGLLISAIFGGDALYALSSHPIFNLFLFAILVLFGLSFLGAFEIQLPTSWANKADSAADRGGLIGIFFMAATLAIVSFSCTGPLVGAALGESASGGFLGPAAIMFGFSLALSLPFMFFAAFPGWLNALPQSGGWLNSVKVVLGLVEIGFAFKFLSNADLAYQWHFLERELFISIWIAVTAVITLYLFGKLRFPHDSPFEKMSVTRFLFGFFFLITTIYLLPGIWGAPLKLIAGFPPPAFYAESAGAFSNGGGHGGSSSGSTLHIEPDYQNDLEAAQEKSREVGKPILVDYTGWTCVNCRKMEENVWIVPEIARILTEEVVLVSLYTDDRSEIPLSQQREETLDGGSVIKIKRLGDEWKYKEAKDHGTIAQPFYCFEDSEGNLILKDGIGYDADPQKFLDYLNRGLKKFKANQK